MQDSPTRALQNYLTESYVWQPTPPDRLPGRARGRRPRPAVVRRGRCDEGRVHRCQGHPGLGRQHGLGYRVVVGVRPGGATCRDHRWREPRRVDWTRPGPRVPVAEIRSFQGPEHCDWQDITFLQIGPENKAVRIPTRRRGRSRRLSDDNIRLQSAAPGRCDRHRLSAQRPGAVGRTESSRPRIWCAATIPTTSSAGRPRRTRSAATDPLPRERCGCRPGA